MLNKIQIKDYLIEVDIVKKKIYELKFEEFENNEYKIYDCIFYFINEKVLFTITVYFKRKNYYYCGIEKNQSSIEFIFSDFISNNICPNLCYIEYNKNKINVKEEFEDIQTRKRISLININLKKCEIPNIDIKSDKEINQNKFNDLEDGNYLISINIINNEKKTIGIFKNNCIIETVVNKKEIIKKLEEGVKLGKEIIKYDENNLYQEFMVNNTINGKEDIELFENNIKKIENLIDFDQDIQKYIKYYDNFYR